MSPAGRAGGGPVRLARHRTGVVGVLLSLRAAGRSGTEAGQPARRLAGHLGGGQFDHRSGLSHGGDDAPVVAGEGGDTARCAGHQGEHPEPGSGHPNPERQTRPEGLSRHFE
jgi:hypothetical protein